jgi:hypothetical protein
VDLRTVVCVMVLQNFQSLFHLHRVPAFCLLLVVVVVVVVVKIARSSIADPNNT